MKKISTLTTLLVLSACGKTITNTVEIPGETVYVNVPGAEILVPVLPPEEPAVICQVFKDWNKTTLPTAHQVKGDLEIGLDNMTLTEQPNDLLPFAEFIGTDAELITNNFAIRCTFKFEVTNAGNHAFTLDSDDGSELYVNGVRIINNGGPHGMVSITKSVNLPEGIHEMRVNFYEGNGAKGLNLKVQRPNIVTTPPVQSL